MVKWLIAIALLLFVAPAQAQLNGCPGGFCSPGAPAGNSLPSHSTGTCPQSNAFFSRVTGLSNKEAGAYNLLICGLVADGIITGGLNGPNSCGNVLDLLYVFATNTTTTANTNLCGTLYLLVPTEGLPVFTSDVGYTAGSGCLNTQFIPSAANGNMQFISAHWGIYILTNRTANTTTSLLGAQDAAGDTTDFLPLYNSSGTPNSMNVNVNSGSFGATIANPAATTQGSWISSRTSPTLTTIYRNGSALTSQNTGLGVQLPFVPFYILARNNNNDCQVPDSVQVSAAWLGGGLNSTQAGLIQTRINNYMKTFGINVY
jgi:hypothetical protein